MEHANGPPLASHLWEAICFAIGFGVLRFLLDAFVYKKLAIRLLCDGLVPPKVDDTEWAKIAKFSESMWRLTYYAIAEMWILVAIYQEPWSRNTNEYFRGWPNQELKNSVKYFYMCQCGFYTFSIVSLVTWETRRKDFSVLMSHHIITTILIGYSYLERFFRIGSVILALHDACDVFMELAKLFKYSEVEIGASICFGLFAASWLILRLVFFPFWVIRSSSYHSIKSLSSAKYFTFRYYTFNTMLLTLLVFHVYWGKLIYAMIRRQLKSRGKVGHDVRSDSDDN